MNDAPAASNLANSDFDPFAGPALARVVPTTEAQREVWLADQLGREASLAYNESISLRLRGSLDLEALELALRDLGARHESLRATFSRDGLELLIAERCELRLERIDLTSLEVRAQADAAASALAAAVETPFDLITGPLLRATLLKFAAMDHQLIVTAHHIVCDGWSFGVICRDLARLYSIHSGGAHPNLEPAAAYSDYALAQTEHNASPEAAAAERYWLARFDGSVPVLDLPPDRPRPARRTFNSLREDVVFDAELVADVKRIAGKHGASLFGVLLAGFGALLARLTGETDVVIGVPSAGQSASDMPQLVGHCVNLLPVRLSLASAAPAAQALTASQSALFDAFEHQRYTFGTLLKKLQLERDPARLPLVSVMFNLDQTLDGGALSFADVAVEVSSNPRHFENFELFMNAVPVAGGLRLECQYNTGLYDAATVRSWLGAYRMLLRDLVARPEASLESLNITGPADRALLASWNRTAAGRDRHANVASLLRDFAPRNANDVAVICGGQRLRYGELDARSNRLARYLRARGARRGALIGLHVERGFDMLVAQLAALKSGSAYVPLDPTYPAERLRYMAHDAQLSVLITQSVLGESLELPAAAMVRLDAERAPIAAESDADLPQTPADARPDDPAYVIYTSGSTGKPKGVVVPHRSVSNFLVSMAARPGMTAHDCLLAVTTLSFDIAVLELLLPQMLGARIVLASHSEATDGVALAKLIGEHDVSMMQATPATWRLLIDAGWQGKPDFKALVGGEALSIGLVSQLLQRAGQVWNMYGPTETTVWSTCWRVEYPDRGISIGTPIANTSVWVLDEMRQLCPIGFPGEICIGGDGVTSGYLNRADLTAERFIDDQFAQASGARLYRTGDRGRWRHDGQLEHRGRLDSQVKVRGYRIEPGEIEASIASHPAVRECVVIAREDVASDVRIVAYFVPRSPAPDVDAMTAELRDHLRASLPEHMIPQHFIALSEIPRLPNGKINRHGLPSPTRAQPRSARDALSAELPITLTERLVAQTMEQLLSLPGLGRSDNFFAVGGHSLLAAQLAFRLSRARNHHVPLRAIFEAPTVMALAAWLDRHAEPAESAPTRIPRRSQQDWAPLSVMQQRLWFLEQLDPGRSVYHTPSGHRLKGTLDEAAFEHALNEVIRRQSSLRTMIASTGDEPVQIVLPGVQLRVFPAEDLSALAVAAREARVAARLTELSEQVFSLTEGPLVRAHMFRLGADEHVFFFMVHHIVWDGWSFDLFQREMAALYAARRAGAAAALPALPVTYGDFAAWQVDWLQGPEIGAQTAHWLRILSSPPEPLGLPADRPRPQRQSGRGGNLWLEIDATTCARLRQLAQSIQSTLNTVLLAAYYTLLYRLTGQRDLVVGVPVRGRNFAEIEGVMGFFVNALPLRLKLDESWSHHRMAQEVHSVVVDALKHPDVPIEQLVRSLHLARGESRFPIYQALFSFQDARERPTHWGNLERTHNFVGRTTIAEDIGVWVLEDHAGLHGGLLYNSDILDKERAQSFLDGFYATVAEMSAEPERAIGQSISGVAPGAAVHGEPSPQAAPNNGAVTGGFIEPATPTEETVLDVWRELLGVHRISVNDNFFDLGGHSLLAMRAIAALEKGLAKRVNPRRFIFESLRQIARAYDSVDASAVSPPSLFARVLGSVRRSSKPH